MYCDIYYETLNNKEKHQHVKDADIVIENNKIYVKLKISHCRMNFGKLRIFDSSGENNVTRSTPIRFFQKLYAILTVNLVITLEIIQEYLQNLIPFYITEVIRTHNNYSVTGQDTRHV